MAQMTEKSSQTKSWPAAAKSTVAAALIAGAVTLVGIVVGALNTTKAGQSITIGNIISNVFNFHGTTAGDAANASASTKRTTVGGPAVRFGINANALVTAWDPSVGFRVFVNGTDTGWQRGGKSYPVTVPPDRHCQIEFLGSPDDISKGKPTNVEFSFSCN